MSQTQAKMLWRVVSEIDYRTRCRGQLDSIGSANTIYYQDVMFQIRISSEKSPNRHLKNPIIDFLVPKIGPTYEKRENI